MRAAYSHSISVRRPQRAINARAGVPPSSLLNTTEYVNIAAPPAAFCDSTYISSGKSDDAPIVSARAHTAGAKRRIGASGSSSAIKRLVMVTIAPSAEGQKRDGAM